MNAATRQNDKRNFVIDRKGQQKKNEERACACCAYNYYTSSNSRSSDSSSSSMTRQPNSDYSQTAAAVFFSGSSGCALDPSVAQPGGVTCPFALATLIAAAILSPTHDLVVVVDDIDVEVVVGGGTKGECK